MSQSSENLTESYVKNYYDSGLKELTDEYTYSRWFSSPDRIYDYNQTKRALLKAFGDDRYQSVLEIGPGDGVWTKLILDKSGSLVLLDQSVEMLKRAQEALKKHSNIEFINQNFSDYIPNRKFNLVLSVRWFEYIIDKKLAIKKMYDSLESGGKLVLVTKNSNYKNISGWKKSVLHSEQVSKDKIVSFLKENGFNSISVYPAVNRWKVNVFVPRILFDLLHRLSVATNGWLFIPLLTDWSTESYTYVAQKS